MIIMIIRERTTLKIHEVTELSTFNKYVVLEVIKTFYWPGAELRAHNHHGKCCSHVPKTLHLHPLQLSIYFKQSVIQHNICETIIINKCCILNNWPSFSSFSAVSRDILPWNQLTLSSLFILNKKEFVWKVNL